MTTKSERLAGLLLATRRANEPLHELAAHICACDRDEIMQATLGYIHAMLDEAQRALTVERDTLIAGAERDELGDAALH